ncbi:MAG TPA: hypothetical protein PLM53_12690 [Spirochaetota bacterium]|nr:hypothetical protein [Spirochaetota bacterium]HPC42110.1 hypothetical protein [Spirochaetota bacterium]HPL16757.1 hypothetical protein [Spirochaetota bacterium]HQF09064.1 hypothetical protein [Spirochaetota bacterium]HQH97952.1 hypothetical protein [Spirochaetota bacterium]
MLKKAAVISILSALITLSGGCSKEEDKSIVPGYWSPGEFRPKGVAGQKAYNFADLSVVGSGTGPLAYSCSSNVTARWPDQWTDTEHCKPDPLNPLAPCNQNGDGQCRVIYATWPTGTSYTNSFLLSGFALDDSHNLSFTNKTLHIIMKVIDAVTEWKIYLILDGVEYRGTVPRSDVTVLEEDTRLYTEPACSTTSTPPCSKAYDASSETLKTKRLTFNTVVTLSTCTATTITPCTVKTVNIHVGDYIVGQMYGL